MEAVIEFNEVVIVYNLRVSDFHTYFVGSRDWGFSVWAHNANYEWWLQDGKIMLRNRQTGAVAESIWQREQDLARWAQREGVQLSQVERGTIAAGAAGSPEHKTARWVAYQERGGRLNYEQWSRRYDVAMQNSHGPLLREAEYRAALGGVNRVLDTPLGRRQIDIFIEEERRMIQLKTGYEYLTTTGELNNASAIARDAWFVQQGYTVEWVLEAGGSQPLLDALRQAGIRVHIGPLIR